MVVRLSLYGSLMETDLEIGLYTFKSISGMSPRQIEQTTMIWEPKYEFKPVLQAGQVNQIEQYRIFTKCNGIFIYEDNSQTSEDWVLEVQEVPEPGRNQKTILQQILKTVIKQGNLFQTVENIGYKYTKQYWTKGYEFICGNTVIELTRVYAPSSNELVDSTQQYTVIAYVDVENLTDRTAIANATAELSRVQTDLKGLVNLDLPARGQFDTRVRR